MSAGAAVKYNIERDIAPGGACDCSQYFPIASIATPDAYTLVLHLTKPFSPIIESFLGGDAPNWIASPTAIRKEGAKQFAITPVGAGPFKVQSDKIGAELQLVRNPHYWAKGKPYLDSLNFQLIGTDESAYEALQANQAQVYLALGTVSIAQLLEALQTQWSQAGIVTTLDSEQLLEYINLMKAKSWQVDLSALGDFDPALGFALPLPARLHRVARRRARQADHRGGRDDEHGEAAEHLPACVHDHQRSGLCGDALHRAVV